MDDSVPNVKDHCLDSLRAQLGRDGIEPYRAEQIASWIYARGVEDFAAMTDLGLALRRRLARSWRTRALELVEVAHSDDGTRKGTLRARDGAVIEAVLIPEPERTTLCVSTQVGCPLACSFCASGAMRFTRNLTTAEILDQVCRMREVLGSGRDITNVVFMGMGEPLLNLQAVLEAIRVLVHPKAFAFPARRVTVSTAGVVPRIAPLLEGAPVNLAVSLHATTDAVRDRLVPLNRHFPLAVLLGTLRRLAPITRRRPVFFEYTLIHGVNDSPEDARRLSGLLQGIPSKLNVIPMNPHPDCSGRPPPPEASARFLSAAASAGVRVTWRRPRGGDIAAACGQLAAREAAASRLAAAGRP